MNYQPAIPSFLGTKILDSIDLNLIVKYIDWTFFFHTWGISGKYPGIENVCECPSCQVGWLLKFPKNLREKAEEALKLFRDAREILKKYISEDRLKAKAIIYFAKVKSENEGITFLPASKNEKEVHIPMLRQQQPNQKSGYCYSLTDFISPQEDYIGAFAVSIHGAEELSVEFGKNKDEYNALLIKSIADRLAEATSEWLHEQVRKYHWGYSPQEEFSIEELRKVPYQGIRPAIGYPSIPDQSVIFDLDELLHFNQIGIFLTENGLMLPNASICGFYFSHPQSFYFMIGQIGDDQLKDYAERKGVSLQEMQRWLVKK
jgi:5-methyltetrahydrofolate--homocysteine methyltransferase